MSGDHIRAVRNSNPGNIETGAPWQGLCPRDEMTPEQAAEDRFCVFRSPKWGFRAIARVLISYRDKHDIETIRGVINRWAPPSENDTGAYVTSVANRVGVNSGEIIDLHSYEVLYPLVKAIAYHECGGWFFDDADVEAGLRLAGVEPPPRTLKQSRTMTAAAGGTVTTIAATTEMVRQLNPVLDTWGQIAAASPYIAVGLIVVAFFAWVAYARWDDHVRARR